MKKSIIKRILSLILVFLIINIAVANAETQEEYDNYYKPRRNYIITNGKIGEGIRVHADKLRFRNINTFCFEHRGPFTEGTYKVYDIITIDGKKATSVKKNTKTITSNANAKMCYILTQGAYDKTMYRSDNFVSENERDTLMSARNIAIWKFQNTWINTLGGNGTEGLFYENWKHDSNRTFNEQDPKEVQKADSLIQKATDYSQTTPDAKIEITGNENVNYIGDNKYGPFKIKYTSGKDLSIKAINISGGNSEIKLYSNEACTTEISTEDIKRTDFYIKTTDKTVLKSVKITAKSDIYGAKIIFLSKEDFWNGGGQSLIYVNPTSTEKTAYVEFKIPLGSIKINKKDANSGIGLTQAGYKIYRGTSENPKGWLQKINNSDGYAFTGEQDKATIFRAEENSSITIANLPYDTYYLSEVEAPKGYDLSKQSEYNSTDKRVPLGSVILNKNQIEKTVTNKANGKITIKKVDSESGTGLKGAGFKLFRNSVGWVKKSGNGYEYVGNPNDASEFEAKDSDTITIENLPYGTYYLSEVKAPEGYELSGQAGYSEQLKVDEKTTIPFKRVALGSFEISKDNNEKTITVKNKNEKKISIKGYVWIDQKLNKDDTYNSLYDESNNEKKVAGVTVNLVNKSSNQAVATTTTNENGEYVFEKVLSSGQLKDHYVEFKYNGVKVNIDNVTEDISKYIPVAFNSTNANEITANGSRAMMNSVAEKDEDLNGIATTYTGTDATKETTYGLGANGNLYSKLISEDGSILDNINLGIKKIPNVDYSISQDIAYLKMIMNGNSYIYYYGNNGNSEQVLAPRISWQKKGTISGYTAPIYPSYIAQEKILNDNSKPENLKIYVVYRTDITNTTTLGTGNAAENMKELYQEKSLVVGNLKNVYDTNRYTLETEYDLNDDNTVKKDFNDWKLEEENKEGTAVYNYNKVIEPGKTESTYIEFKVKRNAIIDILNHPNGIIEKYPTNAIASNTYHNYTRTDYSWTNDISKENQQHRKNDIDMNAEAPYLIFKLGEERILSGKVFKDNVDEAYKKEGQVLGNGKYDEDENVVENVTVDLIDKDGNYATLYKAKSDGTAEAVKAETKTDEKGKYSLNGIVPGEYVLRFTYGDGTQKIRTVGGNEINTVQAIDYKSTIVKNEVAKNALEGKAGIEWYKDLNADTYSVATDNLETRARVNEGTGNTIVAQTAKVGITMENSKKQYEIIGLNDDGNQTTFTAKDSNGNEKELRLLNSIIEGKNTFNGLSFGIIEQPKQSVEIEKLITNVKLTNAQNNVIFNGNPETETMAGVTDLDGKENQGSSYVRVELPEESIYGSNMEVTYQVKVTNTSDLNYYNNEYYWFGDVDSDKEVLFQPTEVKDYLDNSLTYVEDKSDKDRINSIGLKDIKIYGNNVKANAFELKGWTPLYTIKNKNRTEGTSDKVTIVAQRILSNQDNDMEIISKAEITKGENTNSRGEVNDELKTVRPATDVHSESNTKLTITPPTGENRNILTIYIISSIISLVLLSITIVIIKKKIK